MNESVPANGASILLLDDVAGDFYGSIADYVKEGLDRSGCGYRVRAAATSDTALKAALESPPDLVILCSLQGQGASFCSALAANSRTSGIPVLVLTMGLSREFKSWRLPIPEKVKYFEDLRLPNIAGVLRKPFEFDELKASVLDILRKKRT